MRFSTRQIENATHMHSVLQEDFMWNVTLFAAHQECLFMVSNGIVSDTEYLLIRDTLMHKHKPRYTVAKLILATLAFVGLISITFII